MFCFQRTRRERVTLFHAPHYVLPPLVSCRSVVTIHDCIHLMFPQYLPGRLAHRERVTIFRARTLLYFCSILFIASVRFTAVAAQNPAESRVNAAERRKIETAFISSLETSDSTESAIAVSVNPIQG